MAVFDLEATMMLHLSNSVMIQLYHRLMTSHDCVSLTPLSDQYSAALICWFSSNVDDVVVNSFKQNRMYIFKID